MCLQGVSSPFSVNIVFTGSQYQISCAYRELALYSALLTGSDISLAPLLAASLISDPALSRLVRLLAPTACWSRASFNLRRPAADK